MFLDEPLVTSLGYCRRDEFQGNLGEWFHATSATDITQRAQREGNKEIAALAALSFAPSRYSGQVPREPQKKHYEKLSLLLTDHYFAFVAGFTGLWTKVLSKTFFRSA